MPPASFRVVALLSLVSVANAAFGDYADHSWQCPAITTCLPVCVADLESCPPELTCENEGEVLCPSGRECVTNLDDCEDKVNPCAEYPCNYTFACLRVELSLDDCWDNATGYPDLYWGAYDACDYDDFVYADDALWVGPKISWATTAHVFFYCWIGVMTVLLLGWCAFNQRIRPVGSTVPLHDFGTTGDHERGKNTYTALEGKDVSRALWTQTGYKKTLIGTFIYLLIMATTFGFHALLACLTGFYYAQQRDGGPVYPYQNDEQVLLTFAIVWLVAFVWTLSLKWPHSIYALFLRRCELSEADYVAVFAPAKENVDENKDTVSQVSYTVCIKAWTAAFFSVLNGFFAFIFSDVNRPTERGKYYFQKIDEDDSFTFRLRRYNFSWKTQCFEPGNISVGDTIGDLLAHRDGLTDKEVADRARIVGPNVIPMEKPSVLSVLLREGSRVFYTYQLFIIWWWFPFWYWHMGVIFLAMFIIGLATTVTVDYMNQRKLYKLAEVSGTAKVLRKGELVSVSQTELVPGDIIAVESGICQCDLVLLEEGTVLVDESGITGEATPVAKTGVDAAAGSVLYSVDTAAGSVLYSTTTHKKNTISAGSIILDTEEGSTDEIKAVVMQTGSFTTKGNLLRDILIYERHKFKFDYEIKVVFAILILYAIFGFFITFYFLRDGSNVYALFYGMYVVVTIIPPLLPTVFLVSVGISARRLFKIRIACSDNRELLVTGKVNLAFFDKTGTLTHQGLDFISSHSFVVGLETSSNLGDRQMERGMAVCHTLTKTEGGSYIGTFIDEVMFKSSGASMDNPSDGPIIVTTKAGETLKIVKRFEFDHESMTQSVLVENENGEVVTYVKGSVDKISKICSRESLPRDFVELSDNAAKKGIYQLSLAIGRPPPGQVTDSGGPSYASLSRKEVERDLSFVGFMDFKNSLREETPGTLQHLRDADVRSVMVTGDSVFTGIHIAKESGLIDEYSEVILGRSVNAKGDVQWEDAVTAEPVPVPSVEDLSDPAVQTTLAVTGEVWTTLLSNGSDQAGQLAPFISVFGRCTPNDKVSVIAHFVKLGFITLMCGDGGNDCGALKTAHVGIALSEAEASIVSPFTSLDKSIESVIEVLKEGRCCLASALSSYKFMIMWGQLTAILQMSSAYFGVALSEWCWVWLDGVLIVGLAFTLPFSTAADKLSPTRPTASLLGPYTMSSVIGPLAFDVAILAIALAVLHDQDWYQCRKWDSSDISLAIEIGDNYEAEVLFLMTATQYVWSGMAYNFGFTWRQAWYKNYIFVILALGYTFIHYWITLVPGKLSCWYRVNCSNEDNASRSVFSKVPTPIMNPYNTTLMPEDFRWFLAGLMTVNWMVVLGWEYFFLGHGLGKSICSWFIGLFSKAERNQVVKDKDLGDDDTEKPLNESLEANGNDKGVAAVGDLVEENGDKGFEVC